MARVLIVDDDPMLCEVLDLFLSSDGHEVATAADGRSALAGLQDKPVDLAIVDLLMPVKEGFETILELKRLPPCVRVIAMSGGSALGSTDFLAMATKLGADEALRKPVRSEILRKTIAQCLAA